MSPIKITLAPCCDLYTTSNKRIRKELSAEWSKSLSRINGTKNNIKNAPLEDKAFWEEHLAN